MAGLDADTLEMALAAVREFTEKELPDRRLLELDAKDEAPIEVIRAMCGPELGVQLLFIAEEYGGDGRRDLRRLPRV